MNFALQQVTRSRGLDAAPTPWWLWLAPVLLVPAAIAGPNALLCVFAVAVLAAGLGLLWRPGEPPILLFVFLCQWVQSSAGAFYGNMIGTPLAEVTRFPGHHDLASALMLTGTLVLACAMRVAAGSVLIDLNERMKIFVGSRSFRFWLGVYILTLFLAAACEMLAAQAGGLRVPLITMAAVKWVGFVLLTFAAFAGPHRNAIPVWCAVFAIQLVLSFGGYFAKFNEVFLFSLFGLAASNVRLGPRILVPSALLVVLMIGLGLVWTAVKGDYRSFVNAGSGQQVVLVELDERVDELVRLVGTLDERAIRLAADDYVARLMYHQFFGTAAANVPQSIPYADGAIWGEAVTRSFTPRFLFPDKRAVNDSDLTNQYTGLNVATVEQGTSISLGYMAEAYIDFGPLLMFGPIAALGVGLGCFYRWLLQRPGPLAVLGAALAPFALLPALFAETSSLKMIPSLILTLITCMVVTKILAPLIFGQMLVPRSR